MASFITVDDHGLRRKLGNLSSRELIAAEKRGVTETVKLGRQVARANAPVGKTKKGKGGISYKTRTRGGVVEGRVFNKVFYMRFLARGTGVRHTHSGANRGKAADHFMDPAARATDPIAPKNVDREIAKSLLKLRLL